jgi:serine/threonine-protein kinase
VESVDGLPENTLLLGTLQLGENRLFGTFTQAQIPGAGAVPVCLVIGLDTQAPFVDERGKNYVCGPGLGVCLDPGSKPSSAKVYPRFQLHWPTRF